MRSDYANKHRETNNLYNDVSIVIPVLNEGENISALIHALLNLYPGINLIFVDDGSTDKTRQIILKYARRNKKLGNRVTLLDRSLFSVHGLAISVIEGINHAKTNYIVVMDADFQHPPVSVADIVKLLRKGSDIVVGKRILSCSWPIHRRLISLIANLVGRFVLIMRYRKYNLKNSVPHDVLSGFFGMRRDIINLVDNNKIVMQGYKVLFDILKQIKANLSINEAEYYFNPRKKGHSKLRFKTIFYYIKSFLS